MRPSVYPMYTICFIYTLSQHIAHSHTKAPSLLRETSSPSDTGISCCLNLSGFYRSGCCSARRGSSAMPELLALQEHTELYRVPFHPSQSGVAMFRMKVAIWDWGLFFSPHPRSRSRGHGEGLRAGRVAPAGGAAPPRNPQGLRFPRGCAELPALRGGCSVSAASYDPGASALGFPSSVCCRPFPQAPHPTPELGIKLVFLFFLKNVFYALAAITAARMSD